MAKPLSIVILAAGLGTRMKSRQAKVLHRAGGLALVEHVVRAALEVTTAERIGVVVGHQADEVRRALTPYPGLRFATQTEQLGTGHALMAARDLFPDSEGYVVVLYGDSPLLLATTIRELTSQQEASAAAATLITTNLDNPDGYGRILRDPAGGVAAIVEQKALAPGQETIREINSGIYCFRADLLWAHLPALRPNVNAGEIYLTDIVGSFRAAGRGVDALVVEDAAELLGINTRVELAEADHVLRARKARQLMLGGVTIERPETVVIDPDVEIGMDTIVEASARILGRTCIGGGCVIGAGAVIRDAVIADGVNIDAYSLVAASRVGKGARIGPFARLRVDNEVAAGAHIGNFVELKNTRFGAGSKAMHLAYLGDATIGGNANIGAGTITCNYDGLKKTETKIGDGAFVGSNATLVAPVQIGEASYVAAGSVITDEVPGDTLALGRARQTMKPGWPSRRKAQIRK